jgi:signal transduction histidine kinase
LAERLGVKPPSLYNHVDGLPGIERLLALHAGRLLTDAIAKATVGKSRDDAVMAMAQAHRAFVKQRPGLAAASIRAPAKKDQEAQQIASAAVELCLTNYISNAIKYSDPKKAERLVEISARVNEPRDDRASAELVVEVLDNGIGVPSEARSKLFDRFFRALSGDSAIMVEGTGLGLSIVRETVDMLGGRAWAEPVTGGGSLFAFSLPCRRSTDAVTASDDTRIGDEKSSSTPPQQEGSRADGRQ